MGSSPPCCTIRRAGRTTRPSSEKYLRPAPAPCLCLPLRSNSSTRPLAMPSPRRRHHASIAAEPSGRDFRTTELAAARPLPGQARERTGELRRVPGGDVVRLRLAEDSAGDYFFVQPAFSRLPESPQLYRVADGDEAVSYLQGRGMFSDRARYPFPHVMILDLNMPINERLRGVPKAICHSHPATAAQRPVD